MEIKRRYVLTLKLGADSMREILSTLSSLEYELSDIDERSHWSVSGSPSAGYWLSIEFNPEVTHEGYFAAIEEQKKSTGETGAKEVSS